MVDQKGISAEFLPKVSAEIRQKVFLHLFGLSVLLQKHFLSAECQSFCRNCSFLQLESCFEGSMVLHLSWNSYKFPFLHPILCKILHSKELLTCRKNLFLQKDAISAERPSFGSFCISAERNIFGRLSFCFLQNDKIPLSVDHYLELNRYGIFDSQLSSIWTFYRARLRGGPQVWWTLLLLLLTTSAWPCLQHSRNLGTTF